MRYRIEHFRDANHLANHQDEPGAVRPYVTNEREFDSRQTLVRKLERERYHAGKGATYRVTPLDGAFIVEVGVEVVATAWVHDNV